MNLLYEDFDEIIKDLKDYSSTHENYCKNEIININIQQEYIDYISTQLDLVYWYARVGKKNQSNKVMVYLINDMVKSKAYNAIDFILISVNVNRLNSSSMEALRRTTSKLKYLHYRTKFIENLIELNKIDELKYKLPEKFILEEK